MKPTRRLNRRSFFGQVAGGVVVGAAAIIGGRAKAWQPPYTGVTDSDSGSNSDNAGYGRGGRNAVSDNDPTDPAGQGRNIRNRPQPPQTGITDGDRGDSTGAGRGGYTGYSDSDPSDPSGRGRNRGRSTGAGVTDQDSHDAYGEGVGYQMPTRRAGDGRCLTRSGVTDSDTGTHRDPAGYGSEGRRGANEIPSNQCR